jgi:MmyB-like transcription regulator ligand binding domain
MPATVLPDTAAAGLPVHPALQIWPPTAAVFGSSAGARPWRPPGRHRRARSHPQPVDGGCQGRHSHGSSPRFAEIWAEHDVATRRPLVKRVDHPLAGPLEFECQVLHIPDTGQRLITYCAAPGSPTQAAFRRLAQSGGVRVG